MLNFASSGKTVLTLALVLLPIGGAVAWYRHDPDASKPSLLPKELSVDSLRAAGDKPETMMATLRDSFRRDDLTDEQRRELRRNMREVWRSRTTERVNEYFNAPSDEADAVLDRHIDELVSSMQAMRTAREERQKVTKQDGSQADRRNGRGRMGSRSRQDRKQSSESRNPDETARAMLYFNNLRARATDRGIQIPGRGGGRGFGGGGGGRRGSRP
ncbi:MAG: hypothetical protein IH989_07710 [Planctomycetes bacterium]|nr:hypothetical protein [Planctomycetota bacterium]